MKIGIVTRAPREWVEEFELACKKLSVEYRLIDISCDDWQNQIGGIDIIFWRIHLGDYGGLAEASIKIPIAEAMGKLVFPSSKMASLYENKIAQTYLFRTHKYATPNTFASFSREDALQFIEKANYPIVFKTTGGAASSGVMILHTKKDARHAVNCSFAKPSPCLRYLRLLLKTLFPKGNARVLKMVERTHEHANYMILQEYIQAEGDLRVAVLGKDLVSVFWRKNRPDDFRASGSGLWKAFTEDSLPVEPCNTALSIYQQQGFTSMAFDFLPSARGWLLTEISYTFILKHHPWDYSDALFRKMPTGGYKREAKTPIGVVHLRAMLGLFQEKQITSGAFGKPHTADGQAPCAFTGKA